MLAVQVVLEAGGGPEDVAGIEQALAELEPSARQWLQVSWGPYAGKAVPAQRILVALAVLPESDPVPVELVVDATLFQQSATIYLLWGWPALLQLLERLDASRADVAALVRAACVLLRERIAAELAAIEADVTALAERRWQAVAATLADWRAGFRPITTRRHAFRNADAWRATRTALGAYHDLNLRRERSEEERRSTAGLGRGYVPGVNDDEYRYLDIARNWGVREKQYMREAAAQLKALHASCPAAVLVADRSRPLFVGARAESDEPAAPGHTSYRESAVGGMIVDTLDASSQQLDQLRRTLALEGVAAATAARGGLQRGLGETWHAGPATAAEQVVARRCLESWGAGNAVRRVVTLQVEWSEALLAFALERKRNDVLGMLPLVRDYALGGVEARDGRFRACVAIHYLHALEAEVASLRRQGERFAWILTVVNWIASITAVVAFVASVVASGGASLPAGGALVCAFIEGVDLFATGLVLALTALEVALKAEEAREQWRQVVAGLAVQDPDTLREVGATLASMGAMGWQVTGQIAGMLLALKAVRLADALALRLGLDNRIALARRALEMRWLADDIGAFFEDGAIVFATSREAP